MLIDSHAHITYDSLSAGDIVSNMANDDLYAIVTIGTNVIESKKAVSCANKYDNVYATVGIHPDYTDELNDECLLEIENLAKNNKKVVAIGEIGLDYHTPGFDAEKQKQLFLSQIDIASKLNLPICVHSRDASEIMYNLIKDNINKLPRKGVMHCFSDADEYAIKYAELGFYISFSGNITFKKRNREFIKQLPLDKIIVETDAPFLSPEPFRGMVNSPKNVKLVAQKIAYTLEMDYEKFASITLANTKKLYNIK